MAQVVVRNLPDHVVASLKAKAKTRGHSLEQEIRNILSKAAEFTPEEKIAVANRIAAMTLKSVVTDSTDLIREDRDTR